MTGRIILDLEKVFVKENPIAIVYGDTNSTLAAAIVVSSKLHIKIAHIEAGLRSYKMTMPEEINRL